MTYFIFKIQNTVSSRVVPIQRGNDVIPLRMNKPGDCRATSRRIACLPAGRQRHHLFFIKKQKPCLYESQHLCWGEVISLVVLTEGDCVSTSGSPACRQAGNDIVCWWNRMTVVRRIYLKKNNASTKEENFIEIGRVI